MNTKKLLLWVDIGLIVAIAISAVFLGVMISEGPAQPKTPAGVPYNVIYLGPTQTQVQFGNFSETISFTDLIVTVTSPNGDVSRADVKNETLDYAQNTPLKSLSHIRISSTGTMEKGTSFTLMNYKALQIGAWAFKLTVKANGHQVSGGTVIVPDTDVTPKGTFNEPRIVSPREIKIEMSTVTPTTELSFCYVRAWGPNMTATTFYLNDTTSMAFHTADGTTLTVVDNNKDGLLNSGDYVRLLGIDRDIPKGPWSIEMRYSFTGEKIASVMVENE